MKYMGSKLKIADAILPLILDGRKDNQYYVEPFVGGCNVIDKVKGLRIGSDDNHYLIAMLRALQDGWAPPIEISREDYNHFRDLYNRKFFDESSKMIGYIGFCGSYSGRFYDGGYAGITETKTGFRNYPKEANSNIMKQLLNLIGVKFETCDYRQLEIPKNSIIYCDPPYDGTKKYCGKVFDSDTFWAWCRVRSTHHKIYISEYQAPSDFKCIWEKKVSSSLSANSDFGGNKVSTERLFTI